MFNLRIKSFLRGCGFKDIEPREFDIIEGEQESWIVSDAFILTHNSKENYYALELIIPIPGTYEDPPCEDYKEIETYKTEQELFQAYMFSLAQLINDDIALCDWEEKHFKD